MRNCKMCRHSARFRAQRDKSVCWLDPHAPRIVDAGGEVCGEYGISAQAYLEDVTNLQRRIEAKSDLVRRYRDMATRATGSMEAVRVGGTGEHSKVERNMDKAIDLAREIERDTDRLIAKLRIVQELIDGVSAPEGRELLELRYLCGCKWEDVAARMHYERRQSQRIHKAALEDVQRQMDERGIVE